MIRVGSKPTPIERLVLARLARGEDPAPHRLRARVDLQAIGRLRKRGYVNYGYVEGDPKPRYYLTLRGQEIVK